MYGDSAEPSSRPWPGASKRDPKLESPHGRKDGSEVSAFDRALEQVDGSLSPNSYSARETSPRSGH